MTLSAIRESQAGVQPITQPGHVFTDRYGTQWMPVASIRVYGEPKAQPRPRAFAANFGGKFTARMYTAGTAEAWKSDIARAAQQHVPSVPIAGAVRLDWIVMFKRPGRLLKKKSPSDRIPHVAKPDRDNVDKAIMDCLKTIGMFADDCQVFTGELRKVYVAIDEAPGAELIIWTELETAKCPTLYP